MVQFYYICNKCQKRLFDVSIPLRWRCACIVPEITKNVTWSTDNDYSSTWSVGDIMKRVKKL